MLVAGEEEMRTGTIDVRRREGGRGEKMRVDEFARMVEKEKPDFSQKYHNLYRDAWNPDNYDDVPAEEVKSAPKPKAVKKPVQDLAPLEARLSKAQWLGGAKPSKEDAEKAQEVDASLDKKKYPYTYAWLSLAAKFSPAMVAQFK